MDVFTEIWEKIHLEAEAWRAANMTDDEDVIRNLGIDSTSGWRQPCPSFIKCNIGGSWVDASQNCSVTWLTRSHVGISEAHSRHSYSGLSTSLETELLGFYWAAESLSTLRYEKVVFESTSYLAGEAVLHPENFPNGVS